MSTLPSCASPETTPIARLRARLVRLATDPRGFLFPEWREISANLVDVADDVLELLRRVDALERAVAAIPQPETPR